MQAVFDCDESKGAGAASDDLIPDGHLNPTTQGIQQGACSGLATLANSEDAAPQRNVKTIKILT